MFSDINLEKELFKEKKNHPQAFIEEVKEILNKEAEKEQKIIDSIAQNGEVSVVDYSKLDKSRIFDIEHIRNLCIKYRLRFLDSRRFTGNIPHEAILKIKRLSERQGMEFSKFKIAAPSKLFKLEDTNADPLLFIDLGNDKYYLIHQWGKDMKWYYRFLYWPVRSFAHLGITIIGFVTLLTILMPNEILVWQDYRNTKELVGYFGWHRLAFMFHIMIVTFGMVSFLWWSQQKEFSDNAWRKHTFN
jgi:hypothetical protein